MINESTALIRGMRKIAEIFGIEYVKEHRDAPICRSISDGVMTMSYLFQDAEQRPDLKPDYKGWTVYATVAVDLNTEKVVVLECVLPDGRKIRNTKPS